MPMPTEEEVQRMHRYFAVQCNNQAWDLIDLDNRSDAQTEEMIRCAKVAAWHWSKIGKPINDARANMLLGWVCCTVGWAGDARGHTDRVNAQLAAEPEGVNEWDRAFTAILEAYTRQAEGNESGFQDALAELDTNRKKLDDDDQKVFDQFRSSICP